MSLLDSIVVFLVGLSLGSLAIHIAAKFILGESEIQEALVTALLGAVVWSVVGFLFGWVPLLGPVISLLAWIGLINWRYPGGWMDAASIAFVAWLTVLLILYILAVFDLAAFDAVGVPGG